MKPYRAQPLLMWLTCDSAPAFLALRQTTSVEAMAKTGAVINESRSSCFRVRWAISWISSHEGGNDKVILCDRGANFGYDNPVVDMLALAR